MTNDLVRLTYRELGERLGLSPDAARMKARRKGWNTIPGNYPGAMATVEVPADALNAKPERVPGAQPNDVRPERKARTARHEHPNALADNLAAMMTDANARIRELTDQLVASQEAHRADAAARAAAEARELALEADLERMRVVIAGLQAERDRPFWRRLFGG